MLRYATKSIKLGLVELFDFFAGFPREAAGDAPKISELPKMVAHSIYKTW
jgi:hypothetical protein